ncbi:hypothetical protein [Haladaptatus caseinilyticus]|uniref:hypothetical protein n=1 Tax=Haladaptatus caseinilyticus TaxID=2993314 RepID=UPI00224A6548|nr:hypothetical protein [Haladaptatus caseinilyticus]
MPLSTEIDVLVDANIFIAIGHPTNPRYKRFQQVAQTAGVVLKLPHRAIGEIGGPDRNWIRIALEQGWAEIINTPAPTVGNVSVESEYSRPDM